MINPLIRTQQKVIDTETSLLCLIHDNTSSLQAKKEPVYSVWVQAWENLETAEKALMQLGKEPVFTKNRLEIIANLSQHNIDIPLQYQGVLKTQEIASLILPVIQINNPPISPSLGINPEITALLKPMNSSSTVSDPGLYSQMRSPSPYSLVPLTIPQEEEAEEKTSNGTVKPCHIDPTTPLTIGDTC